MPLESNIKQNSLAISESCEMMHRKVNPQRNFTVSHGCKQITFWLASVMFKIIF